MLLNIKRYFARITRLNFLRISVRTVVTNLFRRMFNAIVPDLRCGTHRITLSEPAEASLCQPALSIAGQ